MPEDVKTLEVEKKLIDLQLSISKLEERISGMETPKIEETPNAINKSDIDDIKQRLEDAEDLVMLEQAGILEMKKIIEEQNGKPASPGLEEKIKDMETRMETMVNAPACSAGTEDFSNKIADVESRISSLSSAVDSIRNMSEEMKKMGAEPVTKTEVVHDFPTHKIEELEKKVGNLSNKDNEIGEKLDGFYNKDLKLMASKIEAIEKSVQSLSSKTVKIDKGAIKEDVVKAVQDYMSKLEDSVTSVKNEMEGKIERLMPLLRNPTSYEEMKPVVEKMIILESRIGAIESSLLKRQEMEPIILE